MLMCVSPAKGKPAVGGEVLGRVWLLGLEHLHSYA